MNFWEEYREQFMQDCKRAIGISHENLCRLMEENKDTAYGKRYRFEEVKDIKDYQRLVPVSDYSYYADDVKRMQQGEKAAMTVYDVKHYIMTSGSTGGVKMIPLTREAISRCVDWIYYTAFSCVSGIEDGKNLHMSVFRMEPPAPEPVTIISAACFREMYDRGTYGLEEHYIGGTKLMFSKGIGDIPYAKLWAALSEPEMTGIQSIFLYEILLLLRYFEEKWEQILSDIKARRIPGQIDLSKKVREVLLGMPELTDERIEMIKRECGKGFQGIVKRLWNKVNYISGVGGATFFTQDAALRYYLGDIPIHYFGYAASECLIGIAVEMEKAQYVLTPTSGFFEFIPYGEDESDTRVRCMEELEVGKMYEILVTNFSGLYRYRLNDVLRVSGFLGESPIVEVCFRKDQAINIAGEKMDMHMLAMAARKLGEAYDLNIYEFSAYDDKNLVPGCYQCFLEAHEIRCGEDAYGVLKEDNMSHTLDEILKELNADYKELRELGMIGEPSVSIVPMGTHEECKWHFYGKKGHVKPLQCLTDPKIIEFMKEREF